MTVNALLGPQFRCINKIVTSNQKILLWEQFKITEVEEASF